MALAAGCGIFLAKYFPQTTMFSLAGILIFALVGLHPRLRILGILGAVLSCFWFYTNARSVLPREHLLNLIEEPSPVFTLQGVVAQDPVEKLRRDQTIQEFILETQNILSDQGWKSSRGKILVSNFSTQKLEQGDFIQCTAALETPPSAKNPGQFDYRAYLANKRIYLKASAHEIAILKKKQTSWIRQLAASFRRHMIQTTQIPAWWTPEKIGNVALASEKEISALMSAMLMGYREGLTQELNDAFRNTGTLHLFAVSGQNVAAITGLLIILLQVLGIIHWRWSWILIPVIFIFCLATGMAPSAFRTFLMMTLLFIGWTLSRPVNPLNILGCAALLIWLWEPLQFFDIGFQFSFLVVLALLLLTRPLGETFYSWFRADPWIPERLLSRPRKLLDNTYRILCGLAAIALAAWIGSFPLSLIYFHNFIPMTPVANILIALPANVVVILAVFAVCVSWISVVPVIFINQINWGLLQGIILMVNFLAQAPHFNASVDPRHCWTPNPKLTILYDQRVSPAILQYKNQRWLIDPGSQWTWKYTVDPIRRSRGIHRWNGVILTQSSKAHIEGALLMNKEMPASFYAESGFFSRSFAYRDWLRHAAKNRLDRRQWKAGEKIFLDKNLQIEILWPPKKFVSKNVADNSLVFLIRGNEHVILWANNISEKIESAILAENTFLKIDVLIQSADDEFHLSRAWLEAIRPAYFIRPETRYKNSALDENFWSTARELNIQVFEMSKTGAITIDFSKEKLSLRAFR
ncbi:MAG: ComEC/Rec2 family competence protein [Verrucomicrobiota bacterium]